MRNREQKGERLRCRSRETEGDKNRQQEVKTDWRDGYREMIQMLSGGNTVMEDAETGSKSDRDI